MGRYADLVPDNWTDPILTGPNAALPAGRYDYHGLDIEAVLKAVKARIAQAEASDNEEDGR